MYDNPWTFCGDIFDSEHIIDNFGFIYKITNIATGRMYIGRKYFWFKRKLRKKDKRRTTYESDWKDYYGSSFLLDDDITKFGKDNFKREIMSLHETKGQVNYHEIKLQFQLDVIHTLAKDGSHLYYNTNIMGRYFIPKPASQETKDKIGRASAGRKLTEEQKQNLKNFKGLKRITNGYVGKWHDPKDEMPAGFKPGRPKRSLTNKPCRVFLLDGTDLEYPSAKAVKKYYKMCQRQFEKLATGELSSTFPLIMKIEYIQTSTEI